MQYHIIVASSPFLSNFGTQKKLFKSEMKKKTGMKQQSRTEKTTAMKTLQRMPEYHSVLFKIESNNVNE